MSTPWSGDWQHRLNGRLGSLGFASAESFVVSRPGAAFSQLARELGPNIAPVQVEMAYLRECKAAGRMTEAAAECLARTILERFPRGWGVGGRVAYRIASCLAAWISDMKHDIAQSDLPHEALEAIADALQNTHSPPAGWLPNNGQDPVIQEAFRVGLRRENIHDPRANATLPKVAPDGPSSDGSDEPSSSNRG
ncbi:MAG: hypothetical protein IPM79_39875 [Polyangiaceae bacterium]|jgi:hypothetical protein|nr:hypothetical protein [Polyangiaceae bacterium]MBK8943594.1 hypothetical protein [Polyangiaceae bacterium]